ncbi:MAG: glycoside hydrolase family 31 protein [Bacteroidetes bacterium]|nr:glycoside hydrolase family 31 protein [Bacteroidota bacterium]
MKTKNYLLLFAVLLTTVVFAQQPKIKIQTIAPGVIKLSMGTPDKYSPYTFCSEKPREEAMQQLSDKSLPFDLKDVVVQKNSRGVQIRIPLNEEEQLYGFGMQIGTFEQRGLRKRPIVNDNPSNIGYTHAPQPFYVSTAGYGVLVNTSRYVTFLCGTNQDLSQQKPVIKEQEKLKFSTQDLYANQSQSKMSMWIDVPSAEGVEVFFFLGETLRESVQRYNLFSGGGAMPPLWGLGVKYRVKGDFNQDEVLKMGSYFREHQIPCDVLGLEPGWHTKAYSCSYVWSDKFPRSQEMIEGLKGMNFKVNLWEHAYVNPAAPFYKDLEKMAGSFLVWNGLVPDFVNPKAAAIFADYHEKNLVDKGIASFKLDECDNSNIMDAKSTWGFPDMTTFPSGIDGEQMHQLFGSLYARTLAHIYKKKNQRTYFDYRSSNVFTSSLPAVLYSDIYGHNDYISMISTASFGGLLWSPELRDAASELDFIRRMQTMLMAPQAVVNSWYLKNVPWFQLNRELNNADVKHVNADKLEELVRNLFRERMSLIPYIYSAFADYYDKGLPPFRPLIMDNPKDKRVRSIANQFMIGQSMMAAPTTKDSTTRVVYFPEGNWYDYNSLKQYIGGKSYMIEIPMDKLPLFVKEGSIVPVATPLNFVDEHSVFEITCKVFGNGSTPFTLFEDDGVTYDFQQGGFNKVVLSVANGKGIVERKGSFKGIRYNIKDWNFIK